jgi:hypothetical protein
MRHRRVEPKSTPASVEPGPAARWVMIIAAICVLWIAAMAVVSYLGYQNKDPVRIENWHPAPAER